MTDAAAQIRTDEAMAADAAGRLGEFAQHWTQWQDTAALAFPVETVLDQLAADLRPVLAQFAETRRQLADYENRITWHTTCGQCSRTLDAAYGQTVRAEQADARIAELEKHLRAAAEGLQAYVEAYGRSPAEADRLWWKTCALVDRIRRGNADTTAPADEAQPPRGGASP